MFHQVFPCPQYRYLKIENKHDVYRGKDCIKKFCEQAMKAKKIIHFFFFFKGMNLFAKDQTESYENAKTCYIFKEKFEDKYV